MAETGYYQATSAASPATPEMATAMLQRSSNSKPHDQQYNHEISVSTETPAVARLPACVALEKRFKALTMKNSQQIHQHRANSEDDQHHHDDWNADSSMETNTDPQTIPSTASHPLSLNPSPYTYSSSRAESGDIRGSTRQDDKLRSMFLRKNESDIDRRIRAKIRGNEMDEAHLSRDRDASELRMRREMIVLL